MSCEFSYFPFFGRAGVCTIGGHGEYHILRNACMTFHGRPQGATTGSVRPYCWSQDIGILLQNVTPRNAGQQRCTSLKQQTPNLRALYMHLTSTPHTHHPHPVLTRHHAAWHRPGAATTQHKITGIEAPGQSPGARNQAQTPQLDANLHRRASQSSAGPRPLTINTDHTCLMSARDLCMPPMLFTSMLPAQTLHQPNLQHLVANDLQEHTSRSVIPLIFRHNSISAGSRPFRKSVGGPTWYLSTSRPW